VANDPGNLKSIQQQIDGLQAGQRLLGSELDEMKRVVLGKGPGSASLVGQVTELRKGYVRLGQNTERILRAVEGDSSIRFPGLRADLEKLFQGMERLQSNVDALKHSPHVKVAELEQEVKALKSGMDGILKENSALKNRLEGALGFAKVLLGLTGLAGGTGLIAYIAQLLGVG
jgi:hypothetical protein